MHVLLIAPPWFPVPPTSYGGVEAVVAALADGLVDAGFDVTLVAAGGSRTRGRLHSVGRPRPEALGDPVVETLHALEAYGLSGPFDLVHDHSGHLGPLVGTTLTATPLVHTLHGPWTATATELYRRLSPRVALVPISHDQASRAPADIDLMPVVPNGVDLDLHRPTARPKSDALLFVGRASQAKGPEVAVEVARRLGRPLQLLMKVNEPAELDYYRHAVLPRLQTADVELELNPDVQTKVAAMAAARVLVFPIAWNEPFGLVAAEAAACGTPVAAYARGAAPEIVRDGITGRLAPPGDLGALCVAVEQAATLDPTDCRDHAERAFSPELMTARYVATYRRLLAVADSGASAGRWSSPRSPTVPG